MLRMKMVHFSRESILRDMRNDITIAFPALLFDKLDFRCTGPVLPIYHDHRPYHCIFRLPPGVAKTSIYGKQCEEDDSYISAHPFLLDHPDDRSRLVDG